MTDPTDRPRRDGARRQAFLPLCLLASLLVVFLRLAYLQVWSPTTKRTREVVVRESEGPDFWSRAEQSLRREVRKVGKGTVFAGSLVVVGAAGLGLSAIVGRRRRSPCR